MDSPRLVEPREITAHEGRRANDDSRIGAAACHSGRWQVASAEPQQLLEVEKGKSELGFEKSPGAARSPGLPYLRRPAKGNNRHDEPEGLGCVRRRRILVGAASAFIENQNVTHYFTLTYPRRIGWEGRHKAFLKWLDAIEWMQRRPLGWFRADESCFSGLGFPEIPEHHHGLLVDTDHLCCKTAENLWRAFGDARVERYEPHGGAVSVLSEACTSQLRVGAGRQSAANIEISREELKFGRDKAIRTPSIC